ncbi:stress-inducible protein [Streptomyces hygroscopicus]|uniref:universal stress protein n=1 Tax=Streptomyces hygroscopicus TaxID=1912 RepID=UPI00223F7651|nr:universal stress protein [Streptomyces hygroscopicus]MCW7943869.1 stress-inducible protein [Streptomyces hygroscopicus]
MLRTVTVGLDGSSESRAAAEWAAREAELRGLPLKVVHVWEPVPEPIAQAPLLGPETHQHWTERIPRESAEGLRRRHPGVEITVQQRTGRPSEVLREAAEDSVLLVLGSRALSGIGGFLVGSVSLSVVAHAGQPVVLVRALEQAADEHEMDPAGIPSAAAPFRPVVLGLDIGSPDDSLIEFAFDTAAGRAAPLRVVHGWSLRPYYAYGFSVGLDVQSEQAGKRAGALAEVLRPWRDKYPAVEVVEESRYGSAADLLVDASREASLVVVGRRTRDSAFGTRIGPVAHAVMHHATAPVAVVPHG